MCSTGRAGCTNPNTEPHSCPYQEGINDNNDPEYCTCCKECEQECCDDI